MSRSYKKEPISKDNDLHNFNKVNANRKYRRNIQLEEDSVGNKSNEYKKSFPQYDIHDFISRWDKDTAIRWCKEVWESDEKTRIRYGSFERFFFKMWQFYHNK